MKKLRTIVRFIFLLLICISMTSCFVRRSENLRNNRQHRGWYKNGNQGNRKIYIIKNDNHEPLKLKHRDKVKKHKKDRWDAKK